jgi:RING finger protein 113A
MWSFFFCEKCQLERFKKDMKCATCNENTLGLFNPASKAEKKKLERKKALQDELDKKMLLEGDPSEDSLEIP